MSFIHKASKEIFCKIIYVGPSQSGKTTNIQEIYKRTQDKKTEWTSLPLTSDSTALFDFLPLSIGTIRGFSTRIHLYSIPGDMLFKSSGKLILKGLDGIVFVADSSPLKLDDNIGCLKKFKIQLKDEGYELKKTPLVLQYNKRDLENTEPIFQLKMALNHYNSPEVESIAINGQGVMETLKKITEIVVSVLKSEPLKENKKNLKT